MPVDKFGRHFLRTSPYPLEDTILLPKSTPFYIFQPSNLYSKCIITIVSGESTQKSRVSKEPSYVLENHKTSYKFSLSGKIENLYMFPTNTKVIFNGTIIAQNDLIGKQIIINDKIAFHAENVESLKEKLYVEIVLNCPISVNDINEK